MLKFLKNFFYIFLVLAISKNAHAFDLKALTDKIQKDVGEKLNVPQNNSGSNPLGNMLKGLNQNNAGINMQNTNKGTPKNNPSNEPIRIILFFLGPTGNFSNSGFVIISHGSEII